MRFVQRVGVVYGRSSALPKNKLHCVASQTISDSKRKPRKENVSGEFFVDHTCIDCDTCRWMSPSVFSRKGEQSAVIKQPTNQAERIASIQALLSCPTYSIHMGQSEKGELKSVQESFPIQVSGCEGVFYCGFTDEKSFGACSYFINSPNGNVLVDCPRFNPALIKQFDSLGGIKFIFLTHKDDIGDHEKWAKHYKATRIIHKLEVQSSTHDCEIQFEGEGPWTLGPNGDSNEMEIISTPGHTDGSLCLLHKPSQTMFTGDHFAYSARVGRLSILPRYNG
eukprot:g5213.t2